MKNEITADDLRWFRLANSSAAPGFYAFKARFLKRFAVQDGWDLQKIEKECWTCDGSGKFTQTERCHRCDGSGIHHINEIWLQRWVLAGQVYHVPEFCSPPHHLRRETDSPRNVIEGRIAHGEVSMDHARRAFWRLLLRHEPANFYWMVVASIRASAAGYGRRRRVYKLWRLRQRFELFPIQPTGEDVPF